MKDATGELAKENLGRLLISYLTWRSRFITQEVRRCHLSQELQRNPKRAEYRDAVDEVVARIRNGDDLTPFLSRGIKVAYEPTTTASLKHNKRRDRDLLVADWGVHHLH